MNDYYVTAENEYRRQRTIKGVASSRHGRSRGAWLRHLLHSEPGLERRAR